MKKWQVNLVKAPTTQGTISAADKRKSVLVSVLCGVVFVLSAVLIIIGIAIESSAHNGLGYTLGLLSLIPLGLSAWGFAKHYPRWKQALADAPSRAASVSSTGSLRHSDTLMGAAEEAHDQHRYADEDDQSSDWVQGNETEKTEQPAVIVPEPEPEAAQEADPWDDPVEPDMAEQQRERHMTPKGEEPFIGGLAQMRQAAGDADERAPASDQLKAVEPQPEEHTKAKPRVRVTSDGRIIGPEE